MRLSRLVGLTERRLARRAGFSRILSCGFCLLGNRQEQMLPFLPRNGDWEPFCQLSDQGMEGLKKALELCKANGLR